MSFNNAYTAVTGATYAASDYNTSTKGNFTAIWVGTTAGDMDYYTSSTAKARLALVTGGLLYGGASSPAWLALGSTHTILKSLGGSAPEYGSLVYRRQGGNALNWQTGGTTSYTPTTPFIQGGSVNVSVNTTGSGTISYPVAFAQRPLIAAVINGSSVYSISVNNDSVSGFTCSIRDVVTTGAHTVQVNWFAIGE